MEAEFLGAMGIGCVVAGAGAARIWYMISGKSSRSNGHCTDHNTMVTTLTEVKNDVKWLRKKQEDDASHVLLNGILEHLMKKDKK